MKWLGKGSVAILAGAVALVAATGLAQAETRFAVQDSAGTDRLAVTDQGWLGIGSWSTTNQPSYPLQLKAGGAAAATSVEIRNTGRPPAAGAASAYDAPNLQFTRNNDPSVNNGAPRAGDRLGLFAFGSWFGGSVIYGANIIANAETSTGTSTSLPTYLSFQTGQAGVQYPIERVRIASGGNVGIGNFGSGTPSQQLEVRGAIRLNTTAARPTTCDSTLRGTVWLTQSSTTGVGDSLDVCIKDSTGSFVWFKLN